MTERANSGQTQKADDNRNEKIGKVVAAKMNKTIVVEVILRKAHPKYKRVISKSKKFYAHDEQNTAHTGDVVRIIETRPLSKLKRWRLADVIQRATIVSASESVEQAAS